ncbi:MAG: carbohydrate ABC transporter permease, partial [Roseburia sp.]|nr:carbohydrate ABC transporter permease [Roseburia sp.]
MRSHKILRMTMSVLGAAVLFLIAGVVCIPVVLTVVSSLKSGWELKESLIPILSGGGGSTEVLTLPSYPTLSHFWELLFTTPGFLVVFWNSVKMVLLILCGQLFVALPAGWAFATYHFRGKHILLTLYVILMLMPFQVTMLPSYLVIEQMGMMNTQASVILPAVFSTFPVFIIYRGFMAVPPEVIEAAKVDGAGEFMILLRIGIPLGRSGILSALVLGFLEYWNMIEQPLAFLKDQSLWPVSLYLPEIKPEQAGISLAASVVILIPAV